MAHMWAFAYKVVIIKMKSNVGVFRFEKKFAQLSLIFEQWEIFEQ
jgi:hypothetical protein